MIKKNVTRRKSASKFNSWSKLFHWPFQSIGGKRTTGGKKIYAVPGLCNVLIYLTYSISSITYENFYLDKRCSLSSKNVGKNDKIILNHASTWSAMPIMQAHSEWSYHYNNESSDVNYLIKHCFGMCVALQRTFNSFFLYPCFP